MLSFLSAQISRPAFVSRADSIASPRSLEAERTNRITQHRNTHQLAQLHLTHAGRAVANNAGLFSFIRPMHRCRAGPVLMKNNSSKSAVALQQPFFSVPMSPSKGTPGSRIIVPKQQSPEKPGANEAPIMIAMIKCPVMQ